MNEEFYFNSLKGLLDTNIKYINDKLDNNDIKMQTALQSINNNLLELKDMQKDLRNLTSSVNGHIDKHDEIVMDVIDKYLQSQDGMIELIGKIINSEQMKANVVKIMTDFSNEKTAKKVGTLKGELITGTRVIIAGIVLALVLLVLGLKK
jgi:uncharacterized membrane-anchored protein YhcB (DUF1043 family)